MRKFCFSLGIGFLILQACFAAPSNSNKEEALKFAKEASVEMYKFYDKIINDVVSIKHSDFGQMVEKIETLIKTADDLNELVKESLKFDVSKFKDEDLKHIFKTIQRSADEMILGKEKFMEIAVGLQMLEELSTDKDIPGYKNDSVELSYFPDIQNIFIKSNDPEEMKYYWSEWRKRNAAWAVSNFDLLIKSLREAAKLTEISPIEYWLNEYNMTEMENIMSQIEPMYLQLHSFIRYQLYKKYGDSVVKLNEPIPDHLFQQVLAQTWTDNSIIDEMFPHKDLPPYDEILMKNNYDATKLYRTADEFYQSLGFEPVPEDYWVNRIKMSEDKDEGDCHPTIFDDSQNVYMQYCQKMDFKTFLQAHGYMARVYYAREKKNLPAYYFPSHDLEYPVGEAVILSASTPKHLKALGMITDFKFTDEVLLNRLLRMSIHTMLNIPVYFVHTKVMADLLDGHVEMPELNKHYWNLMNKYVGVAPPNDRVDDSFDFPFKFYIDLNTNKQAKKFTSEVLGYQIYKKMCQLSGQYPEEALHTCDFYKSKKAGDALKEMMKLGSSKPLRKVLETIFPEDPIIKSDSLLEYYNPVQVWLKKMHQDFNLKDGWSHVIDKKVNTVVIVEHESD